MASNPSSPSKKTVFLRRLASTLGLWAVVAGGLASRMAWAYLAIIGILTLLATIEYFRMAREGGLKCFSRFGILATGVYSLGLYYLLAGAGAPETSEVAAVLPGWFDPLAIFVVVAGSFVLQLRYSPKGIESINAVAATLLGFAYIAFLFGFAAKIVFGVSGPGEVSGAMLLLWLIAVTKFTDMGAYVVGSMIGKRKMIPHVSPGKTWEGILGGCGFALLAGCGLFALFKDDMPNFAAGLHHLGGIWHAAILSLVLAAVAVIGDLAESVIKRSLGSKDSGNMLPGIGGALDLIDSLCFTAPVLYFYLQWVKP